MTRKLKALLLVLAITFCGATFAQDKAESQSPLEGLLKGVRIDGGIMPQRGHSSFKLILPDKTFMNFMVMPQESVITAKGNMEFVSDSVFIENVEKSANSTLDGKANVLQYQLENETLLYVKFFIEKSSLGQDINQWYEEVWMRVEMPDQKEHIDKTII